MADYRSGINTKRNEWMSEWMDGWMMMIIIITI
jgi:hypothetical protein